MAVSEDRRVRRTKTALQQALISLLQKQDCRSITVQELAETADVHRATFYKHYQDVYDLYAQTEDEVIDALSEIVSVNPYHSYEGVYMLLIDFIYDHAHLLRTLLGMRGTQQFVQRFCAILEERCLAIWMYEKQFPKITEEMKYTAVYHVQGYLGVMERWLKQDMSMPRERLLQLLKQIGWEKTP